MERPDTERPDIIVYARAGGGAFYLTASDGRAVGRVRQLGGFAAALVRRRLGREGRVDFRLL